MPYRLYIPPSFKAGRQYPLVVYLHGSGGRGSDNEKQIAGDNAYGSLVWTKSGNQFKHPCFVAAPQCPDRSLWAGEPDSPRPPDTIRLVAEIVQGLRKEFSLDPCRFYIVGVSMGGVGVWEFIRWYPDVVAAAVPVGGWGDKKQVSVFAKIPIWVLHGEKDHLFKSSEIRSLVGAIRKKGGNVRYTEFSGIDHDVWRMAFANPNLISWIFKQKKRT